MLAVCCYCLNFSVLTEMVLAAMLNVVSSKATSRSTFISLFIQILKLHNEEISDVGNNCCVICFHP
jgi:hypothetical protein